MLNDHIRLKYPMSPTHTHNNIAEKKLPHMDIPNFAATCIWEVSKVNYSKRDFPVGVSALIN
jgi:hypothetical protein